MESMHIELLSAVYVLRPLLQWLICSSQRDWTDSRNYRPRSVPLFALECVTRRHTQCVDAHENLIEKN